jgi:hypothetical protein
MPDNELDELVDDDVEVDVVTVVQDEPEHDVVVLGVEVVEVV